MSAVLIHQSYQKLFCTREWTEFGDYVKIAEPELHCQHVLDASQHISFTADCTLAAPQQFATRYTWHCVERVTSGQLLPRPL